jgi:hypothetical protein
MIERAVDRPHAALAAFMIVSGGGFRRKRPALGHALLIATCFSPRSVRMRSSDQTKLDRVEFDIWLPPSTNLMAFGVSEA